MNRRERELNKELRSHLDRHIADLIAQGHEPAAALVLVTVTTACWVPARRAAAAEPLSALRRE